VEIHAEGRHGHRGQRGGLGAGREARAERELHAGGQRGVEVEVEVVGGADHLVDLREHGRHALRGRRRRGQEAQLPALLLVRAFGDQAVQVYVKAEVAAEALLGPSRLSVFKWEFGRVGEYGAGSARPGEIGGVLGARVSASEARHEEAHRQGLGKGSDDDGRARGGEHVAGWGAWSGEQQDLSRRRRCWWGAGAVEDAGDGVGVDVRLDWQRVLHGLCSMARISTHRVGFDLDEHIRVDQPLDLEHRGRRPMLAEELGVGPPELLPARDIRSRPVSKSARLLRPPSKALTLAASGRATTASPPDGGRTRGPANESWTRPSQRATSLVSVATPLFSSSPCSSSSSATALA